MKKDEAVSLLCRIERKIKSHTLGNEPNENNIMVRLDDLMDIADKYASLWDEAAELRLQVKEGGEHRAVRDPKKSEGWICAACGEALYEAAGLVCPNSQFRKGVEGGSPSARPAHPSDHAFVPDADCASDCGICGWEGP